MREWIRKHQNIMWYLSGLLIVSVSLLPYFILGENVWVLFHDQLDGEVLNYIYQAKYLFQGSFVPELMNGIPKTGMLPPAPFGVFFYVVLSPFKAYVCMQILVTYAAYTGLFLVLLKLLSDGRIAFLCACLFTYLPLMPVYGLSIAGLPLLLYAFWNLYEKKRKISSLLLIILYAGFSSFALIGFGVCAVTAAALLLILLMGKRTERKAAENLWLFGGFLALCLTYLCCNASLFGEIFFSNGEAGAASHREEIVQNAVTDYFGAFRQFLLGEETYTPAFAGWILVLTVVLLALCVFCRKKEWMRLPAVLLGGMAGIAFLALFWNSALCLATIRKLGPLRYFQADRVSWLLPPLWYVLLGVDFKLILRIWGHWGGKENKRRQMISCAAAYGCILLLCGFATGIIYQSSFFYHQIRQVVFPDTYRIMTWKQYYAQDLMEQVEECIAETSGMEKSEYRVASLGMSPAAALYHGFYCLDGYSNNYLLDYKHTFREVIAPELEKSEAMRIYFDDWGNRCYLMSAESGATPMIDKYRATAYENLELDMEAFSGMGGEYIFSAMEIVNCEELGLSPEGVFETPGSYYKVYLYHLRRNL